MPKVHTIVMYPRPQPDTVCAYFLLQEFGEKQFPGVRGAKLEFWNQVPASRTLAELEEAGYILIDLGGSKFDHHVEDHREKKETAATLVAKELGVSENLALKRLLSYAKRDDLEGRGIVSKDVIDRAFGLSAIIMNLNREYPDHPEYVVDIVYRIFLAHYHEEYRRKVEMPEEWKRLQQTGKAVRINIPYIDRVLHVVLVESDSKTIVGFLRAVKEVQADIVVQRSSSGHTNIITNQNKGGRIDLKLLIRALRWVEGKRKGLDVTKFTDEELVKPGRLEGIDEWFYDTAANTIQNGGAAPDGIVPTRISFEEMRIVVEKTFTSSK
ncbi:MAG: hypothetical protein WD200_00235 [Candidatus Andersenbacteria bacterium]